MKDESLACIHGALVGNKVWNKTKPLQMKKARGFCHKNSILLTFERHILIAVIVVTGLAVKRKTELNRRSRLIPPWTPGMSRQTDQSPGQTFCAICPLILGIQDLVQVQGVLFVPQLIGSGGIINRSSHCK